MLISLNIPINESTVSLRDISAIYSPRETSERMGTFRTCSLCPFGETLDGAFCTLG